MTKLIGAGAMLAALTAAALAFTGPTEAAPAEERVSLEQLGSEVDARLHTDLQRLAREAAAHNAATRHGHAVKVAAR